MYLNNETEHCENKINIIHTVEIRVNKTKS